MAHTVATPVAVGHLQRLERVQPVQAKADLKNLEVDRRARIGQILVRALQLAGLSQKEFAGLVDRDVAQVARWCSGAERPQFDVIDAVEVMRGPLVAAWAEVSGGCTITMTISLDARRRA